MKCINAFATRVPAWYPPLDAAVRSNPRPTALSGGVSRPGFFAINLQVRS
jgi:hypothetical protein